jgi:trehalose/maltose hydrolase-like predicted phosphorylase
MFRGVAGIVCREDKIEVNPHMMPWWDSVSFNFLYHGQKITVKMTNEAYTLTTDSEKEIKVVFRGKELSLSKASAVNEKM